MILLEIGLVNLNPNLSAIQMPGIGVIEICKPPVFVYFAGWHNA
jgi:hypothetical protein